MQFMKRQSRIVLQLYHQCPQKYDDMRSKKYSTNLGLSESVNSFRLVCSGQPDGVTSWSEQTAGSQVWGSATQRLLFQWAHISIFTRPSTSRLLTRAFFGAVSFQHCSAFNRGEQTMNVSEPVFWVKSIVRASTRGPMITCWAITHGLTQIQRQSGLHLRGGGWVIDSLSLNPMPMPGFE